MKNKLIIIGLVLSGFFFGCQTEYEAPNSLSDIAFYNSAGTIKTLNVALNRYMTFTDLSQGQIAHTWQIEKEVNFLQGPIAPTDKEFKVIRPGDTLTSEKTIILQFNKAGISKVRLYNVFKDSVTFRGNTGGVNYFMGSKKIADNKWAIDTTFMVKVYDTIHPVIEVKQNNVVLNLASKDTIYVEAGDKLNFADFTTQGEPTGRTWTIRKALAAGAVATPEDVIATSSAAEAEIVFKKLGVYRASIAISRSAQNIPGASKTLTITRPIKVIPSSKPFIISGTINEQKDETLKLAFFGEFAPFADPKSSFLVKVNGITFPIQSVTLNAADQTVLDLKLVNKIYRPDVITVSYNGTSLKSVDNRVLAPFTDSPVTMHNVNLLPIAVAGMEDGGNKGTDSWKTRWDNNGGIIAFSQDRAASGKWSMKVTIPPGATIANADAAMSSPIILDGTKEYILEYKVWVESATVPAASTSVFLLTNWGWSLNKSTFPVEGKWETVRIENYKSSTPLSILWLRTLPNASKTSNMVAYYDDFFFIEKEVRP